jgi:hypothetical protein
LAVSTYVMAWSPDHAIDWTEALDLGCFRDCLHGRTQSVLLSKLDRVT